MLRSWVRFCLAATLLLASGVQNWTAAILCASLALAAACSLGCLAAPGDEPNSPPGGKRV